MLLTLDSSVFVAALRSQETLHRDCSRILEQISNGQHVAVEPLSVLVEVVAAIRRRTGSVDLAHRVQQDLRAIQWIRFVELDGARAEAAAEIARKSGVRGMDAIVVQVAQEFGSALVTIDDEMLDRAKSLVATKQVTDL